MPADPLDHARQRLIVALDLPSKRQALECAASLEGSVPWFKVGLELYLAAGNAIVEELRHRGYSVFLDLKLHDIPNTVAGAVRSAAQSGAALLTLHAAGGPAMIAAARQAAAALASPPRLLAVTVLTSMDQAQLEATGLHATPAEQAELLGAMALTAGADGLVCSPEEAGRLRNRLGPQPLLVTPGIRPAGSAAQDQKRTATPGEAIRNGASFLVIGRPIVGAPNPLAAAQAILAEMAAVLAGKSPADAGLSL